jgi:hypothetical protein
MLHLTSGLPPLLHPICHLFYFILFLFVLSSVRSSGARGEEPHPSMLA